MYISENDLAYLEKCTKEELIYFIKKIGGALLDYSPSPEQVIGAYRVNKALDEECREFKRYIDLSEKADSLMKPYVGKKFSEVPASILCEYGVLLENSEKALRKSELARKRYDRLTSKSN